MWFSTTEAYQRLGTESSPLAVGQIWWRSEGSNFFTKCFKNFSIIPGPHGPILTRAVRKELNSNQRVLVKGVLSYTSVLKTLTWRKPMDLARPKSQWRHSIRGSWSNTQSFVLARFSAEFSKLLNANLSAKDSFLEFSLGFSRAPSASLRFAG